MSKIYQQWIFYIYYSIHREEIKKVKKIIKKLFLWHSQKKMKNCGCNVFWGWDCSFAGLENISIGNNVSIGRGAKFWSTHADLIIHDDVLFGPNVSIHTGNHDYSIVGKKIINIKIEEMSQDCFDTVEIFSDTWIGDGVKILKGVTIARGCVIAAGAVVTKSTEPYGIYGGIPAKKIGDRFSADQIKQHEEELGIYYK